MWCCGWYITTGGPRRSAGQDTGDIANTIPGRGLEFFEDGFVEGDDRGYASGGDFGALANGLYEFSQGITGGLEVGDGEIGVFGFGVGYGATLELLA